MAKVAIKAIHCRTMGGDLCPLLPTIQNALQSAVGSPYPQLTGTLPWKEFGRLISWQ
jgi:hypothetical protein